MRNYFSAIRTEVKSFLFTDVCQNCNHLIANHEYTFRLEDDFQVSYWNIGKIQNMRLKYQQFILLFIYELSTLRNWDWYKMDWYSSKSQFYKIQLNWNCQDCTKLSCLTSMHLLSSDTINCNITKKFKSCIGVCMFIGQRKW